MDGTRYRSSLEGEMMRWLALLFGLVCGTVVVAAAARYGYKTSDNDADGIMAAFLYASITIGGLLGHPVAIRVCRNSRTSGGILLAVSFGALLISLSNSLGALAGRGNETQAKRMQVAETVRTLKRSLDRAEHEREGLRFTPTNAEALRAAKVKADAATVTKEAECKKRGEKCRDREADEAKALEALESAAHQKSLTDRALGLDIQIAELKTKIETAGPVLDVNPQGSAIARLLNLPETDVASLSAWQSLAMVIMIEILIVASLIAFEVLGRDAEAKAATGTARKPQESPSVLEVLADVQEHKAFPAPAKPRLVASQSAPVGNVPMTMAEIMSPGRGKVEFAEAFAAYRSECKLRGKTPVSIEAFTDALTRLCGDLNIGIEGGADGGVYLMRVKLLKRGRAENSGAESSPALDNFKT
jgi:hypothetical protein